MRTALCMSGHVRTFNKCFPNIMENILLPLKKWGKVDWFFSTWDTVSSNKSWCGNTGLAQSEDEFNIESLAFCNFNYLEIEKYEVLEEEFKVVNLTGGKIYPVRDPRRYNNGVLNFTGSLYKIFRANLLKDTYAKDKKVSYDLEIRLRPDVAYPYKLDIPKILANKDKLAVCKAPWVGAPTEGGGGQLRDLMVAGSPKLMATFSNLFLDLPEIFTNHFQENQESVTFEYLERKGIEVENVYEDVTIVR